MSRRLNCYSPHIYYRRRFFTARLGKPEDALAQFKEAVNIRNSINHIETYDTMNVEEYETVRKLVSHSPTRMNM